jgi:hypothetical protein
MDYWWSDLEYGFGGRDRDRTGDLIVANDALSQLSYSPTSSNVRNFSRVEEKIPTRGEFVVWRAGKEAEDLGRPSLPLTERWQKKERWHESQRYMGFVDRLEVYGWS